MLGNEKSTEIEQNPDLFYNHERFRIWQAKARFRAILTTAAVCPPLFTILNNNRDGYGFMRKKWFISVPFAIGTETLGSIASPSTRNGVSGLRPTFGRVSRAGAMALSWSMDKIGLMCRTVQDCVSCHQTHYNFSKGNSERIVPGRNNSYYSEWNPVLFRTFICK